jgi:WD40 repeat protein
VSPDGNLLAANHGDEIRLWDLRTRQALEPLIGHRGRISAIAMSPDNKILASSSLDNSTKLWDIQQGRLIGSIPSGRVSSLAFSPDGRMLATGSRLRQWADGAGGTPGVQFWDSATRQFLGQLGQEPVRAIAFSPNGALFAAGDTKTNVWNLQDKALLYRLNSGELTGIAFQTDKALITSSSKIKTWNLSTGQETRTLNTGATDFALSPDRQTLALAVGGTVQFLQIPTEQLLGYLRGSSYSSLFVRFALQGQAIVVGNSEGVRLWQTALTPAINPAP